MRVLFDLSKGYVLYLISTENLYFVRRLALWSDNTDNYMHYAEGLRKYISCQQELAFHKLLNYFILNFKTEYS